MTMRFETINWITSLLYTGVLYGAGFHLLYTVTNNLVRIDAPVPHEAQARRMREAATTWLTLPALAYLLAIITNVGSSLIDLGDGFSLEQAVLGLNILVWGFVLLEVIAVVAVQRARNKRTGMAEIEDWPGLVSEVREGGRRRSLRESEAWLEDVEDVFNRLTTQPNARTRRAQRAAESAAGQILDWKKRPIVGLFSRRLKGQQRGFHAREAGLYRTIVASVRTWLWTTSLVLCLGFWSSFFWYFDAAINWPGTLRFAAKLIVATFAYLLAARGNLLYWVRVGLRDDAYKNEIREALNRFAEKRRLTQPVSRHRTAGLFRRLLGHEKHSSPAARSSAR
jgi:hypothetical protein